jgi:hypothetical protein
LSNTYHKDNDLERSNLQQEDGLIVGLWASPKFTSTVRLFWAFIYVVRDRYLSGRVRKNIDNRICGSNLGRAVSVLVLFQNPPPQHDKLGKHH